MDNQTPSNKLLLRGSIILLIISALFTSSQLSGCLGIYQCLNCTYLSLLLIPLFLAMILMKTYPDNLTERRKVQEEELKTLYSEAIRYSDSNTKSYALDEAEKLKKNEIKLELDALPLRLALADIYPETVLVSKIRYELNLLQEYTDVDDEPLFEDWSDRIEDLFREIENEEREKNEKKEKVFKKLRAELKTLREQVAQYEKTWAEGEMIFKRVLYWAASTAIIFTLVGILPIIHPNGNGLLSISHWGALGIAGALLQVLVAIRDPNMPELGETKGKQVLQQTILGIVIGGLASVLLYAALSGEILAGKIFPQIPISLKTESFWINTGGSIFWGLTAGFSLRIFAGLIGIAESGFMKKDIT